MDSLRQEMLSEIRAALGPAIPGHAMTFRELREGLRDEMGNAPEQPLRRLLGGWLDSGTWKSARRGSTVYYWPVEEESE